MKTPLLPKLTDFLTHALAISLAITCLVFAGYKVVKLRQMENPPADMGLNFRPPKRKIITDDSISADPLTTGTMSVPAANAKGTGRLVQPYTKDAPIREYRLLTVIDGVAFVEVLTLRGKEVIPLVPGVRLPGAGIVDRIALIDGRWTLTAADVTLATIRQ